MRSKEILCVRCKLGEHLDRNEQYVDRNGKITTHTGRPMIHRKCVKVGDDPGVELADLKAICIYTARFVPKGKTKRQD